MPDLPYHYTYDTNWHSRVKPSDEATKEKKERFKYLLTLLLIYGCLGVIVTLLFMGYV